jgi:hypothetical protein
MKNKRISWTNQLMILAKVLSPDNHVLPRGMVELLIVDEDSIPTRSDGMYYLKVNVGAANTDTARWTFRPWEPFPKNKKFEVRRLSLANEKIDGRQIRKLGDDSISGLLIKSKDGEFLEGLDQFLPDSDSDLPYTDATPSSIEDDKEIFWEDRIHSRPRTRSIIEEKSYRKRVALDINLNQDPQIQPFDGHKTLDSLSHPSHHARVTPDSSERGQLNIEYYQSLLLKLLCQVEELQHKVQGLEMMLMG